MGAGHAIGRLTSAQRHDRRGISCRLGPQRDEPAEIEGGAREPKEPVDLRESSQFHLPHPGDRLEPAKRRFDPGPRVQTLRVTLVARGPRVDGAPPRRFRFCATGGVTSISRRTSTRP